MLLRDEAYKVRHFLSTVRHLVLKGGDNPGSRICAARSADGAESGAITGCESVLAIGGKTLRGPRETGKKKLALMVFAWAEGDGLCMDTPCCTERNGAMR